MKGIIAVVMLAVGVVLGFTAGLLIRDPSVVSHPRSLLEPGAPSECLRVIRAAEDFSRINRDYLSLVRRSYLPMLQQRSAGAPASPTAEPAAGPALESMLAASQRLADLGDRSAAATVRLDESADDCTSQVR